MGKVLHLMILAALCSAAPARSQDLMLEPASGHVVTATVNEAVLRLRVILDTLAGASRGMVLIRVRS